MENQKKMTANIYPFYPNLCTAIKLADLSKNAEDKDVEHTLAKSAIIHCCFVIEAIANSLISNIGFQTKFEDSIEKLDPIAKLEFFSYAWKGRTKLDRGSTHIQVLQELISIRNNYVHPKKQTTTADRNENGDYVIEIKGVYNQLKIAKDYHLWNCQNAKTCIEKLLSALDYFIIEHLQLCNKKVMDIVFYNFSDNNGKCNTIIPPKPYPWSSSSFPGFHLPKFLSRLESHDYYCINNSKCSKLDEKC